MSKRDEETEKAACAAYRVRADSGLTSGYTTGFFAGAQWEREQWLAAIEELENKSCYGAIMRVLKRKMGL